MRDRFWCNVNSASPRARTCLGKTTHTRRRTSIARAVYDQLKRNRIGWCSVIDFIALGHVGGKIFQPTSGTYKSDVRCVTGRSRRTQEPYLKTALNGSFQRTCVTSKFPVDSIAALAGSTAVRRHVR